MVETRAANAGSPAFTIWPKETAPAESAKTDAQCAIIEQKPTGSVLTMSSHVTFGVSRASGAAQRKRAYSMPTPSCSTPMVMG